MSSLIDRISDYLSYRGGPGSILATMDRYQSGSEKIRLECYEPGGDGLHPALLIVHGSGGSASYWLNHFAPRLSAFGLGVYAPHYFDKTGTTRATAETILDGHHFPKWLRALEDAVAALRARPAIDAQRIGVLGISLGGYLAVALGLSNTKLRLVIELSGGIPPGWEDHLSAAMPPTLVLHGAMDNVVPISEAYKLERLLKDRGARHQVEILPQEGHWISASATPGLLITCGKFLAKYF